MLNVDVLVFGSGIAGLYIAKKITSYGMRVLVLERAATLAHGPTSRNGSLLHGGGFHSAVIDDHQRALSSAADCRDGSAQIASYCPEAIARHQRNFLGFRSAELAERGVARWQELGLKFRRYSASFLTGQGLVPSEMPDGCEFFDVGDMGVDYRMLCYRLLQDIRTGKGVVWTKVDARRESPNRFVISTPDGIENVHADMVVHATGYDIKRTVAEHAEYLHSVPTFGLWKSHSLLMPCSSAAGFLFVDPGLPSIVPSGDYSVVNISQRDIPVDGPDFGVDEPEVQVIYDSLSDIGMKLSPEVRTAATACLKPALIRADGSRTVDMVVIRPSENDLIALPGKATTSPLLADIVLQHVVAGNATEISQRPSSLPWSPKRGLEITHGI